MRRYDNVPWRFIVAAARDAVGQEAGETLSLLDNRAKDRGIVWTLNGAAAHTGRVATDDPEINLPAPDASSPALLSHTSRLVYGFERDFTASPPWVCRFGGIVLTIEDATGDAPTATYKVYDPWQYLFARPVLDEYGQLPGDEGVVYQDARASDVALDLLVSTVLVHGDVYLDFTSTFLTLEDTVVIPGETRFDRGLSVGEAWQQLCETGTIDISIDPVYDPMGRPDVVGELRIESRAGTTRTNAVMAWDLGPRSVTEISRLTDGTRLANEVQFYAGRGGEPVALQSDAASVADFGEWWAQQFMVGYDGQEDLVELLALAQLQIRKRGHRTLSFSPAPERSPAALREYGLGDYLPLWASRDFREPIAIDYDAFDPDFPGAAGYQRVYAIPMEIDDNGTARVRGILTASESTSDA